MKVVKLEIRKHDQYNDPYQDEVVGMVQIMGSTGKMEVRLKPATIAKIFKMCRDEVQLVATHNAGQAGQACDDAGDEITMLAENGDLKQLAELPKPTEPF